MCANFWQLDVFQTMYKYLITAFPLVFNFNAEKKNAVQISLLVDNFSLAIVELLKDPLQHVLHKSNKMTIEKV